MLFFCKVHLDTSFLKFLQLSIIFSTTVILIIWYQFNVVHVLPRKTSSVSHNTWSTIFFSYVKGNKQWWRKEYYLSWKKVLVLLHFLDFQKSIFQRHWDQILCQRHKFIAPVYCWTLCNNRMDLIILWAVAFETTELEWKFMPVHWTTQDPADLKRSQKIIETFQWAIGEQGEPLGSKASLASQRHRAISGV